MREIDVFRTEQLVIEHTGRETIHDIKSRINKTQDLIVESIEPMENKNILLVTVRRELTWYPDTIK